MGCASSGANAVVPFAPRRATAIVPAGADGDGLAIADFHADYILLDKLGNGAYGSVYSVAKASCASTKLAVKVVDVRRDVSGMFNVWGNEARMDAQRYAAYRNEVRMMGKVSGHGNVCQIVGSFAQGGLAYIVQTLGDRTLGEALERLPTLSESTLLPYFRGMLSGLAFVHLQGVVHRDVKPDNFMCRGSKDTVMLCDFGLACACAPGSTDGCVGICGTAPYMAPELLTNKRCGAKADVWSFGVAVYALFYGRFPYVPRHARNMSSMDMREATKKGVPAPSFEPSMHTDGSGAVSECAANWVRELLARDPIARPTCEQALDGEVFRNASASTSSLRSAYHSAVRRGAVDCAFYSCQRDEVNKVDARLVELNTRHHPTRPSSCDAAQPMSEESTDMGSVRTESG